MSERPLPSALVGKVIRGFRTTTDPKGWKAGHVNIPDLQDFFYGKGVQPDLVFRVFEEAKRRTLDSSNVRAQTSHMVDVLREELGIPTPHIIEEHPGGETG